MKKRETKKRKNHTFSKLLLCVFFVGSAVFLFFQNFSNVNSKNEEKKELTKKLNNLKEEEIILSDDVEKLKDPEYAARYAREKYLYSKNGEKIIKMN